MRLLAGLRVLAAIVARIALATGSSVALVALVLLTGVPSMPAPPLEPRAVVFGSKVAVLEMLHMVIDDAPLPRWLLLVTLLTLALMLAWVGV